jgi:hypothetical protein
VTWRGSKGGGLIDDVAPDDREWHGAGAGVGVEWDFEAVSVRSKAMDLTLAEFTRAMGGT